MKIVPYIVLLLCIVCSGCKSRQIKSSRIFSIRDSVRVSHKQATAGELFRGWGQQEELKLTKITLFPPDSLQKQYVQTITWLETQSHQSDTVRSLSFINNEITKEKISEKKERKEEIKTSGACFPLLVKTGFLILAFSILYILYKSRKF